MFSRVMSLEEMCAGMQATLPISAHKVHLKHKEGQRSAAVVGGGKGNNSEKFSPVRSRVNSGVVGQICELQRVKRKHFLPDVGLVDTS